MTPRRLRGGAVLAALLVTGCPARHVYPDGSRLAGQLDREVQALQQTVQKLQAEAANCEAGGKDTIYAELSSVLGAIGDDVTIEADGPVTVITLPESHLFGSDGTSIREEAYATLDIVATALRLHVAHKLLIEGHSADTMPGELARIYPDLWTLSFGRAVAVRDALVTRFRLPEERLALAARGPYAPIVSNDTTAGQARNRRVVLRIYPPGVRR